MWWSWWCCWYGDARTKKKKERKKERNKKMMILITMTIMVLGGRCRSFSSATTATNALLDRCQAVVELQTVPYTSNDDVALSLGDSRSWFDLSPRESFYALCTGLKLLLYLQYDGRAAVAMDSCACALETIIRTSLKYSTTDLHRQVVYTFIVFFIFSITLWWT